MKTSTTHTTRPRPNPFLNFLFGLPFITSHYPRLLLEVFIRKNFGARYFSIGIALTTAAVLCVIPWLLYRYMPGYTEYRRFTSFWAPNAYWYIFMGLFIVFSFIRFFEMERDPVKATKSSADSGEIHIAFYHVAKFLRLPNRYIPIILEPLFFFILGLLIGGWIRILLSLCSISYAIGYYKAFHDGDSSLWKIKDTIHSNDVVREAIQDPGFKSGGSRKNQATNNDDDEPTFAV